jgi:serine/threonine protein phosphatase PrpC
MTMKITSFAVSDRGARDYNEDAHADADLMAGRCTIVADGAGGHRGGSVASRLAVDAVLLSLAAVPAWDDEALVASIDAAGASLSERQRAEPRLSEMASTIALLCIDANAGTARWAHLGDTRILLFRGGAVQALTRDHSVVQSVRDAGFLSGSARAGGPDRTLLYAAVGAEGDMRPSVGEPLALEDGDAFLLCSDGVWDTVEATHIAALLEVADTVQEWVDAIAAAVRQAAKPNQDNYTAVGVWVGSA